MSLNPLILLSVTHKRFVISCHFSMKHQGCIIAFARQRNSELLRAFRHACRVKGFINIAEVSVMTVNSPCSRFWVSEERAAVVVSDLLKGRPVLETMRPLKREMFQEIFNRFLAIYESEPQRPLPDIVFEVVNSPAPKFYIEPRSAMEYIYKIKKGHYKSDHYCQL